ncbi:NADAR family protein [Paraburkholderia phymatum]|uniref:NADAR domain-containing protein n=1 Tax=Paraburkholderia phymatum (strain DSM 17167 / CIP 108236 / LMG 21445 / STM815) TaxID=391038 RepID=B2JKZ6_PARP8|nr:NADAR family protein [Paraburkholderia phymatum]ACC72525.1 conserved hypothetical protein [Paraburkholderia phymatum STM815]
MVSSSAGVRSYTRKESVVFRKTTDEFGGLSNMAPNFPLFVVGVSVRTSEALYQACRFPHLPDVQKLIIEQTSPMTAKMKSKPYRPESRQDWDRVRNMVMRWCLRVKLAENWQEFGDLLLATGARPIVEDSSKDAYWGAIHVGDGIYRGENVLGRLLMELRKKLIEDPDSLRVVKPLALSEFLLLGKHIEAVTADQAAMSEVPASVRTARLEYLRGRDGS